jgi:small subunit ribosomal protein S9
MSTLDLPGSLLDVKPATPAPAKPPRTAKPADKKGWWWGTGRRKTAIARVRLKPAAGNKAGVSIIGKDPNKSRPVDLYFSEERDRRECVLPLIATNTLGKFEVVVQCRGGGFMGQAGAVKLGIARALLDYDPTTEAILRGQGMLTRDSRKVERKKYGQAGARRRFQFSKR